MLEKKM